MDAFWQRSPLAGERIALLDGRTSESLSYQYVFEAVRRAAEPLQGSRKKLALLYVNNDVGCLLCYLTLLRAGYAIWPWSHDRRSARDQELIERYRPDAIVWRGDPELPVEDTDFSKRQALFGYTLLERRLPAEPLHEDLALLLPTSGSTGNPRLVRLSYGNVASNAAQIVQALRIEPDERWLASLPFHYVFGLSVVHSVLEAGATLVLGEKTMMQQGYWQICKEHGVTGLPAIPSQLTLMRQVGHSPASVATLRKIIISGGAMQPAVRNWLTEQWVSHGVKVYSMYGMTEAAGRIAVLPPGEFGSFPDSVGRAVAGGVLRIRADQEVEYRGPNVMMGYAECRAQLALGDVLGQVLSTGDLGRLDDSARLYLTGRRNRICKLFGVRIDLNDVEALCEPIAPVAAVSGDRVIYIFHTQAAASGVQSCLRMLSGLLGIPVVSLIARQIDTIPRTSSGKIHYAGLLDLLSD